MAGAPKGNRNAAKESRIWGDELRRAIAQDDRKRVRQAIEKQLDKAAKGDLNASRELADRLDGKPAQYVETTVTRKYVSQLPDEELERYLATDGSSGVTGEEEVPPESPELH